jgi:hypothetical protein
MFAEIAEFATHGGDPTAAASIPDRHGLQLDLDSVPGLVEKHGLVLAPPD